MTRPRPLLIVLTCLLLTLPVAPAAAVAPGENGEIVVLAQDPADSRFQTVVAVDPATGDRRELVPPNIIDSVAVSPDGTAVAYTLQRNLYVQPLGGTTDDRELLVQLDAATYALEWSPDGSEILVVDGETFTAHPVDGSAPRVLAPNRQSGGQFTYQSVTWTSQDQIVAIELSAMLIIDAATGESRIVDPEESPNAQGLGVDASPDGSQLVFACVQPDDNSFSLRLCITGLDMVVQRTVDLSDVDVEPAHPAFSPDGTQVAFIGPARADDAMLYVTPIAGAGTQALGAVGGLGISPEWAVAGGGTPPPPPASEEPLACGGFDGDPTTTERADFADPIAYAVAVSQARFDCDGSRAAAHVVLSRDDAFADSLVGAALTGDGPLLFTRTDTLPDATATEIDRLLDDGGTIYLLGGTAAISQAVADQLTDAGHDVQRLAGPSRVETSVAVATEVRTLGDDAGILAIARAGGPTDNPTAAWADSVTAGAWTAADAVPTVVTDTASLHPAVADFIADAQPDKTFLLGGEAALSPAVADAVPNPTRIAGASRAGTAQAIATQQIGPPDDDTRELVVINGFREDGWLFGLPAAGLAADTHAPIALAQDPLPPETTTMACSPDTIDILLAGGLDALPDAVTDQLDAAPGCAA
ncbi:cell wall-binding repeat-containing protein [Euzebya sp.]|uniref:cell wall-binding repeat-containing protein n=1 Tax=Euzebya sp. TaxID=1971409 RepID=UPI003517C284